MMQATSCWPQIGKKKSLTEQTMMPRSRVGVHERVKLESNCVWRCHQPFSSFSALFSAASDSHTGFSLDTATECGRVFSGPSPLSAWTFSSIDVRVALALIRTVRSSENRTPRGCTGGAGNSALPARSRFSSVSDETSDFNMSFVRVVTTIEKGIGTPTEYDWSAG
jgi:hypothetical protein